MIPFVGLNPHPGGHPNPDNLPKFWGNDQPLASVGSMFARTPRSWHCALWGAALLLLPATGPVAAHPTPSRGEPAGTKLSQSRVLPYPVEQVWGAAIRYLRVDRDYAIVDRDPDTGYIVFEIPLGEVRGRGALEAFSTTDPSGRVSTQIQISTEAGPTHLPHTLIEGIAKKVRGERGQAPSAPAPKPPASPPKKDENDGHAPTMPAPAEPNQLLLE